MKMTAGIPTLPQDRLDLLLAQLWARRLPAAGASRFAVLAILAVLAVVAGHFGEVDLGNLLNHLSGLTSYFGRILPKLSYANFASDVAELVLELLSAGSSCCSIRS